MGKYFLFIFICFFIQMSVVYASEFHKGSLFKIKLIADHEDVECEYKFPADYRCEKSGNELEEKKARQQLLLFFQQLHLHRGVKAEEMVDHLHGYGRKINNDRKHFKIN